MLVGGGLTDRGNAAAATAYVLVFPAFLVYQVFVQAGMIAPALGGYGTAGAVAALPFALYALYRQSTVHGFAPTAAGALFFAYLTMFAIVVFIAGQLYADPEVTRPHMAYIFKFVVWYLIARSVDGDSPRFRRLALLSFFGVCAIIIVLAISRQSLAAVLRPMDPSDTGGDYQGSAMVLIVMAAYALPKLSLAARLPAYVISVVALFLVGARSEFIAFFLLLLVIEWCKARSRLLVALLVATGVAIAYALLRGIDATLGGNRILGLLEIANDESAILRAEMVREAWITVWQNPVIGAYASYPLGEYAHNLVSAWVDFGIVGFFLLLCLLALPLVGLALRFDSDSRRDEFIRALSVAAVVALLMSAAKTHTYQLLAISLGFYARYRLMRRVRLGLGPAPPRLVDDR